MAVDHNNPQSRNEEILIATIDGTEYDKLPQSRIEELLLELKETIEEGGGGGGTTNYNNLSNQPQVNGETLIGDKTGADLGLVDAEDGKGLSTNDYDDTEKAAVAAATSAIAAIKDGSELDSFGDVEVALLDKADTSDLGTAAAKNSTNAVTSGSTDLVESGAVKDAIDSAVSRAYHHAGTKTVAQLTHDLLVAANEGNVYEMTDSGTTTSDFMEGIGKPIKEGDNVGVARVSEGVYKFDLLSGFVDTTNFVQKSQTAGLLKNDGTVNDEIEGDIDSLKSGLTNLDNEVNGDAVEYPYADVITIPDAIPANVADCNVKIEPVQDLHGYGKPWVGGADKNKFATSFNQLDTNYIGCDEFTVEAGDYVFKFKNISSLDIAFWATDTSDITDTTTHNVGAGQTASVNYTVGAGGKVKFSMRYTPVTSGITPSDITEVALYKANDVPDTYRPYTNICPITGHTEASVQRDGSNFLDTSTTGNFVQDANGYVTYTYSGGSTDPRPFNYSNAQYKLRLPAGSYKLVTDVKEATDIVYAETQLITSASVVKFSSKPFGTVGISSASFTLTEPTDIGIMSKQYTAVARFMIVKSTDSNDYVPYQGKTYTIALGDTIYGGTVNFDSGVMTVTRKCVDLGSLDFTYDENQRFTIAISDMKRASIRAAHFITSCYLTIDDGRPYSQVPDFSAYAGWDGTAMMLSIHDSRYSDAETYKTAITGQTICYELATPTTIQLTPQQIQLLKGTNTLTASTGQISVTVNGVSGAIGGLESGKQDKTDYALETTDKTVVGAINEVQDALSNLIKHKDIRITQEVASKSVYEYTIEDATLYGYTILSCVFVRYSGSSNKVVVSAPQLQEGTDTIYIRTPLYNNESGAETINGWIRVFYM